MKTPDKIFDVYGSEHIYEPVRAVIENDRDPGGVLLLGGNSFRDEFTEELHRVYVSDFGDRTESAWEKEGPRLLHIDDEVENQVYLSFASEKHTAILIGSVATRAQITEETADLLPIRMVLVLWPWENDELKYLPKFTARYPHIPVYILWPNRTWEDGTFHAPGVFPRVLL